MKCSIPEISWHNRDPVLSIDLQPASNDGVLRLATAGTDSHVLVITLHTYSVLHDFIFRVKYSFLTIPASTSFQIWSVTVAENGAGNVEFLSDLARHQRAVNSVRFSPNGEFLASGDDGLLSVIIIISIQ